MPSVALRLVRAATAVAAIAAIGAQAKVLADNGALDLVNFLSYFTIQSNLIGIVALGTLAVRGSSPKPAWLEWLRGASTVYLTVTFFVVLLLLQGIDVGLQLAWVDFVLHKLTPVVIVADWLLDRPSSRITTRQALSWLIFPLIWLAYTLIRGPIADWYPYPFLDPNNGGYGQVAVTSVMVFVAGAVLCVFYAWLGNRSGRGSMPQRW